MGISYDKAVEELKSVNSVDELRNLILSIDVSTDGNPTLFFSGAPNKELSFAELVDEIEKLDGSVRSIRPADITRF